MLSIEPRSEVACRELAADGGCGFRRAPAKEADETGIGAAQIRALEGSERVAEEVPGIAVHSRVLPGRECPRLATGGDVAAALVFRAAEVEGIFRGGVALLRKRAHPDP